MRRRLVLSHVAIVALVLVLLEIPLGILFTRRQDSDLAESATRQAALIATFVGPDFDQPVARSLNTVLGQLGHDSPAEITVVDRAGAVIAARHGRVVDDADAAPRGAVGAALTGQVTTGVLHDDGGDWTFAAVPVTSRDSQVGAVLVSLPRREVERRIATTWALLGGLALGILALAALAASLVALWLNRPVDSLASAVARLSAGDLNSVAPSDAGPPELRDLAQQFNDMAKRLRLLLDSQRRFLADASHQLRAPLTALRLRIENLVDAPVDDVEAALTEADRLSRLLDGLLALSRAEGVRAQPDCLDVTQIAIDRIDAWTPLCAESGVTLRLDDREDTPAVSSSSAPVAMIAPGHLEQILDNLIANSLEVSPPGSSIDISVGVEGPEGRGCITLTIIDHGPGMTEEQRLHAFDRFWQSDTRPTGSSGLGLPIVEQLAQANGGRISLRATADGGLAARLTLVQASAGASGSGKNGGSTPGV